MESNKSVMEWFNKQKGSTKVIIGLVVGIALGVIFRIITN